MTRESVPEAQIGECYKVTEKKSGKIFIAKSIPKKEKELVDKIINEAQIMSYLNCDELIKLKGLYEHKDQVTLIVEYMQGGPIGEFIQSSYWKSA